MRIAQQYNFTHFKCGDPLSVTSPGPKSVLLREVECPGILAVVLRGGFKCLTTSYDPVLMRALGLQVRHYAKAELRGFIRVSVGMPAHTDALLAALAEL